MKVIKLGGGCLRNTEYVLRSARVILREKEPPVVVVSALHGITDLLNRGIERALESEKKISGLIHEIKQIHLKILDATIGQDTDQENLYRRIQDKNHKLERLLHGIAYTGEASAFIRAQVLSYGERLSAILFAGVLQHLGIEAQALDADEIGAVTDDLSADNSSADLPEVRKRFSRTVKPLRSQGITPVITGYFGCTPEGKVTTFGRNGSDYSAAVFVYALEADTLEIWKEVDGFMSADPRLVKEARRIDQLSYYEAAELSYFGAKILHPRTVEPLAGLDVDVRVCNLLDPDSPGTRIAPQAKVGKEAIKSVTYTDRIAVLRIHGPGVGCKPGIIGRIGSLLSGTGINIFSILTSQTCINLLVDKKDAASSRKELQTLCGGIIERVDLEEDTALIAVVGEGLPHTNGIAARIFSAVSRSDVNVRMISAGASEAADYFLVRSSDTEKAVRAIHREFFSS